MWRAMSGLGLQNSGGKKSHPRQSSVRLAMGSAYHCIIKVQHNTCHILVLMNICWINWRKVWNHAWGQGLKGWVWTLSHSLQKVNIAYWQYPLDTFIHAESKLLFFSYNNVLWSLILYLMFSPCELSILTGFGFAKINQKLSLWKRSRNVIALQIRKFGVHQTTQSGRGRDEEEE